jgi:hypothetical protein
MDHELDQNGGQWGDVTVRPFRECDAADLARFWAEREFDIPGGLYHGVESIDAAFVLRTMADNATLFGLVARSSGRIIAYGEVRRLNEALLSVCYVYIAPELRGRTFSLAFLFSFIRYAAALPDRPLQRVVVFFCPGSRLPRQIYLRLGLVDTGIGQLELLTPTLMTVPTFRRYATRHGLFKSHRTYLRAASACLDTTGVRCVADPGGFDRFEWEGTQVLPQRFCIDGDWIEVLIDAESREICRVACPEWRIALSPGLDGNAAGPAVVAANMGTAAITLSVQGDDGRKVLSLGQTVTIGLSEPADRSLASGISVDCAIDGDRLILGSARAPALRPMSVPEQGEATSAYVEATSAYVLRQAAARAVVNLALGGCVHSFSIGGRELLRASPDRVGALGWIYPWKGGLFAQLEDWPSDFQREPWGPFPEQPGFNTAVLGVTATEDTAIRVGRRGNLVETARFTLKPDCLQMAVQVDNQGDHPCTGASALFAFLHAAAPPNAVRARAAEGQMRAWSRRSFTLDSRREIVIATDAGEQMSLRLTQGDAVVRAFNLGDDGMHLMMAAPFTLAPAEATTIGLTLRLDRHFFPTRRDKPESRA